MYFFFIVKDFSGTTLLRILKFGTNIEFDLYYVREHPHAVPFIYTFFFLSNKICGHMHLMAMTETGTVAQW